MCYKNKDFNHNHVKFEEILSKYEDDESKEDKKKENSEDEWGEDDDWGDEDDDELGE